MRPPACRRADGSLSVVAAARHHLTHRAVGNANGCDSLRPVPPNGDSETAPRCREIAKTPLLGITRYVSSKAGALPGRGGPLRFVQFFTTRVSTAGVRGVRTSATVDEWPAGWRIDGSLAVQARDVSIAGVPSSRTVIGNRNRYTSTRQGNIEHPRKLPPVTELINGVNVLRGD